MKIRAFILYQTNEFVEAELTIIKSNIKEINFYNFKNIYPEENNSEVHKLTEIKETHNPERIQNGCKYYIQYSINGEVLNIYLNITKTEYLNLRKQIFIENTLKSKEFVVGIILAIIAAIFALFN